MAAVLVLESLISEDADGRCLVGLSKQLLGVGVSYRVLHVLFQALSNEFLIGFRSSFNDDKSADILCYTCMVENI